MSPALATLAHPTRSLASRIERRLLVSHRLDPVVARRWVPEHLELDLVDGSAVAGMCLIRLARTRPAGLTPPLGWGAENIAHRVAVRWTDADGARRHGVYIPHRHSASRLATAVGGRLFPGVHERAAFTVTESTTRVRVEISGPSIQVIADVAPAATWSSSLFPTLAAASAFYRRGSVGLSPKRGGGLEAVTLEAPGWAVEPTEIHEMTSSLLDTLPPGSVELDSALLMRDLDVIWHRDS